MQRKPSYATTKLTLFAASKNEWSVEEDTDMSTQDALYKLRYAKRNLSS